MVSAIFIMEIGDIVSEPTEPDHSLVWLTLEQIKEKLFLPHQIWAVEQVCNIYGLNLLKRQGRRVFE